MRMAKRNPKIYVISGKAGSGKNTAASIITDIYGKENAISIAYASYLKEYAKNILCWDGNEDNKPREFLQQLGVELIKNNIDSMLLVNRIIEDIKVYSYFYDVIVVSDARFKEEIDSIRNNFDNVTVIHIYGKDNNLTDLQRNHSTEISLDNYEDYDYEIVNNTNKTELKNKIEDIIKRYR